MSIKAHLVEIYQNCPVFNDGTFFAYSEKETKKEQSLFLSTASRLLFGATDNKGIKLDGTKPVIVDLNADGNSVNDLWVHDGTR